MAARFHHPAQKTAIFAQPCQMIAGDVVAGMGADIVVGPAAAPQVGERVEWAVGSHHYIGEVDRTARVVCALHHRRGQQINRRAGVPLLHIDQPTEPGNLNFAPVEEDFPILPAGGVGKGDGQAEFAGQIGGDGPDGGIGVGGLQGGEGEGVHFTRAFPIHPYPSRGG